MRNGYGDGWPSGRASAVAIASVLFQTLDRL